MDTKLCSKCFTIKPIEAFSKNPTGTFGRRGDCKDCRNSHQRQFYEGMGIEAQRARRAKRADERAAWQAAYYQANKERHRELGRRWVANNLEKHRANTRETMRRRRSTAKGKLESNVARAVHRALKGRKNGEPSFVLLGFTVEQLMSHLERQFSKGMTWQNYGRWHVDHIKPLASFSYDSAEHPEFKIAWAITNLQPLWAEENIRKGGRVSLLV